MEESEILKKIPLQRNNSKIAFFIFVLFVVFLLLIANAPFYAEDIYLINYLMNVLFLFLSLALLLLYFRKNKFDIFNPIVLFSFLYLTMFFVAPIRDLLKEQYKWWGYNLWDYGIKSSIYAFIGYFALLLPFFILKNKNKGKKIVIRQNNEIVFIILILYFICFLANIFYMIAYYGMSPLYIFSLGLFGDADLNKTSESIGFISMLSYSLPTLSLLYIEFGRNKFLKFILFILAFILQVSRGFRFLVIAIFISLICLLYMKKNKRPKMVTVLLAFFALMFVVLLMTLFRDSIRFGFGINIFAISLDSAIEAFDKTIWENFRIYQNFYGMVGKIPSVFDYCGLQQILVGTLVMAIPRFIWPDKISSYGGYGLKIIIGQGIADGQAYPGLGEFYYSFGIIGIIVFMFLYGFILNKILSCFGGKNNDKTNNTLYSVLLGCNLQFVIRGYMPSNFWYLTFSILPILILKLFATKQTTHLNKHY